HAAAERRTGHAQHVAQRPQQWHVVRDVELAGFAIDVERDHRILLNHRLPAEYRIHRKRDDASIGRWKRRILASTSWRSLHARRPSKGISRYHRLIDPQRSVWPNWLRAPSESARTPAPSQHFDRERTPRPVAMSTRSGRQRARIFCITLPRCPFTVISLMPR